jgi:membrane-associated phospholipid phosphatase
VGSRWASEHRARAWLAAGVVLFALFAGDLLLHGPLTSADAAISKWMHGHIQPAATAVLFFFTHLHSTIGLLAMSAALAVLLAATRRARWIVWLLLTVQGGQVLNVLVKDTFQRARPDLVDPLVTLATYSFPSGHAAGSTVFWGFVCVLVWNMPVRPAVRRSVAAMACAMVGFTALSRVYLGAHYVSDVLAGMSEGVVWVALWAIVRARTMRA